ncbi:hypothetical protein SDC9_204298 [bioreactor metagenome]|uniref:Uncharacterized protein n=1 Tax=bioreactor metagenome TaxID=1076179 RepID=A0A645IYW2_9ZZZZ
MNPISQFFNRSANFYRIIVADKPSNFTNNHRHGIGGEFYTKIQIKSFDSFYKSDTADLKQIIPFIAAISEPMNDASDQVEILLNNHFLCCFTASLRLLY